MVAESARITGSVQSSRQPETYRLIRASRTTDQWLGGGGVFMTWKCPTRISVGLAIEYVDNFAFEGEVSPIVIVGMLLAAAATAGGIWGRKSWLTAATAWMCVPLVHLVKHVLGLPDTLHPNTYTSILMLAGFT